MRSALGALVIALGFACASVPPPPELDALRREAMVHSDLAALRELFADGLRYGHANGDVHAKEELLGLLGSGRLDYRAIRVEEIETREQAGTWVVTGRQTVEVTVAGREVTSHSVFSAVYARECRHWQLVAYQSTQAPPSGGARSERSEQRKKPETRMLSLHNGARVVRDELDPSNAQPTASSAGSPSNAAGNGPT
jgi:hypothetical protein